MRASPLSLLVAVMAVPACAAADDRLVPDSLAAVQLSYAPVVRLVAPAVVNIYSRRVVASGFRSPFMDDPIFEMQFTSATPASRAHSA